MQSRFAWENIFIDPALDRCVELYGIEPTNTTSERIVRRDSAFEREEGSQSIELRVSLASDIYSAVRIRNAGTLLRDLHPQWRSNRTGAFVSVRNLSNRELAAAFSLVQSNL